jgi:hypothetical protein
MVTNICAAYSCIRVIVRAVVSVHTGRYGKSADAASMSAHSRTSVYVFAARLPRRGLVADVGEARRETLLRLGPAHLGTAVGTRAAANRECWVVTVLGRLLGGIVRRRIRPPEFGLTLGRGKRCCTCEHGNGSETHRGWNFSQAVVTCLLSTSSDTGDVKE